MEKKEKTFLREILVTGKRDCGLKLLFFFHFSFLLCMGKIKK